MLKTLTTLITTGLVLSASSPTVFDKVTAGDPSSDAQIIQYDPYHTPKCEALLRFNTAFIIQKTKNGQPEKIIDVSIGDKGNWEYGKSSMGDAAYIHPHMVGIKTNIDISTDHGNHYSCDVYDQSGQKDAHPHLKVIFVLTNDDQIANTEKERQFYTATEFNLVKQTADTYKQQAELAVTQAQQEVKTVRATAKTDALADQIRDYSIPDKARQAPFYVTDVSRDRQHTYVFVNSKYLESGAEAGSVYALIDGKTLQQLPPAYDAHLHAYVTQNPVLGTLVLRIGKKEVRFERNTK